jgi:uncharacterized membrane protein
MTDGVSLSNRQQTQNKKPIFTFQNIVISSSLALVITQIITKKLGYNAPSDAIDFVARHTVDGFIKIGDYYVVLSKELLKFVSIKTLADAIYDIVYPLKSLFLAPYSFFRGVIEHVQNNDYETSLSALATGFTSVSTLSLLAQRLFAEKYRPSDIIGYIAKYSGKFYSIVGSTFAHISNFYSFLKLDLLVNDAYNISVSTVNLLISPIHAYIGYNDTTKEQENKRKYIYAGSLTIIGLVLYTYYARRYNMTKHIGGLFRY